MRIILILILTCSMGALRAEEPAKEPIATPLVVNEAYTKTASGLQYQVVVAAPAGAPMPKATDTVRVHYVGTLMDGTKFDSSVDRGQPVDFPVNAVIQGFSEGLQLMGVGSTYRIIIPAAMGYGASGAPGIPGNSDLCFEIQLIAINPK